MTDGNDRAYPAFDKYNSIAELGLTKREYFAAMAMQGFIASGFNDHFYEAVKRSVAIAIELENELNKQP
jgi:hypothetical protein